MNKLTKVKAEVKSFEKVDLLDGFGITQSTEKLKKLEAELEKHRQNRKHGNLFFNK